MGMKPAQFVVLDTLGALIMIPLLIALGYYFGLKMEWLGQVIHRLDFILLAVGILAAIILSIYLILKKMKVL
jgi:membrane protein DedA with SNARE-associated domain